MNKPLSPQGRLSVQQFIDSGGEFGGLMQEVLKSEAYWREVVKHLQPVNVPSYEGSDIDVCPCCGFEHVELKNYHRTLHPDCPWLVADE